MAYLGTDGCELHYEVWGEGPPVVLTSGGMSPGGAMQSLVAPLAESRTVIVWDRPNHGASQVSFDGPSELDLCARHLRALVEHIGLGPAVLVGASEGTRVNVRCALRHPDVVAGLFLWQVSAGEHGVGWLRENYYERYARLAEDSGMAAVAAQPWWGERIKFNGTNRERLLGVDPALFAARMRSWAAELDGADAIYGHADAELAQIAHPTWVVAGVDPWHPEESSRRLAAALPNGKLVSAPYAEDAFDTAKEVHDTQALVFVRYADMPGIGPLLNEFLATVAPVPT